MHKLQTQGVHHITVTGADRQSTIDFWEGVLGMPFVFEQPNLDDPKQGHLYFEPGDGRLITVFTSENRKPGDKSIDQGQGYLHHLAFNVSKVTFDQLVDRLAARGIKNSGPKDRGFMDSIYFRDPCGMLIEMASYRFEPPAGLTHTDVLHRAHLIRVAAGDSQIDTVHLADAITALVAENSNSLSDNN
ncbi:VOC family protein [Yoonia sediminilitoris]|uniref:Catechol 2,3-dioxygenase-like lactoylglutathione lyase family enzyme n=1 Tax=Yoonia sediminilitoris TaxID=1286148 RepID=A0A2T6K929_9RHOB|nr:VOC family protein [Yoonia sediminilitoris]PUB11257.1 catechol 2,3-dioxygenase-like lactoylglutathione lyase family enzyme [Yoonia sediminilitoris]RCW91073.1 catechol 2,3-dioxygenase-like lactoylglutathione lyase family enzyme [Yoonia sediminilitoris]